MSPRTEVELPGGFKLKGGVVGVVFILVIVFGFWWMQRHDELVPVRAANDALRFKLTETAKHIGEELRNSSTLYEGELGRVAVGIYRDRCVALIAYGAGGDVLGSTLLTDLLKDADRHALLSFLEQSVAAQGQSRCDYVNHGPVAKYGEEGRQGYNVLMHYLMADGCEFRQWIDTYHNTFGPRTWIVCRH